MEPPSPYPILISNDSGRKLSTEGLHDLAQSALSLLEMPTGELSLRLTGDEEIRALNRLWRGIDAATDVLTFPAGDIPGHRVLGDIAVSMDQAERQAGARELGLEAELGYLILHGILHLKGLEDESEEDRAVMIAEMARIGQELGLPEVRDWHTMEAA